MRLSRRTRLAGVALAAAASLILAACGGGDDDGGAADAVIRAHGTEPQNPLIPTNTNEVGGGNVIDLLYAGLVTYELDGTPKNEVAESIESDDNVTWTIKLNEGWKFSDGTEIKAQNFVDAWNYGAAAKNAQLGSYFFEPIKGYAEAAAEGSEVEEMSGLKVVDDYTFTVELNGPESDFPVRLGYSAYVPLPDGALDDVEAFGENPVGNGPYMLDGEGAWEHNKQIKMVPNPEYQGDREPQNAGVTFVLYKDEDSAYSDLQAGNLDVLKNVPASALQTFKDATDIQPISKPGSVYQAYTIPERLDHFGDNEEGNLRRRALSMAIDRESICEKIFFDSRTPATDYYTPALPGYSDELEGDEVLEYNPDEAKKLWDEADQISDWGDDTFKIGYNADSDHKAWADAVANGYENVLGIKAEGAPTPTFDEFRELITTRKIDYAFRSGWQADYPSLYNYLAPQYASGAADGKGSNDGDYKSKEFDDLLKKGASADSEEDRIAALQEAEEVLLKDLPGIPLWYTNVSAAAAEGVENVEFNWKNVPAYELVTK